MKDKSTRGQPRRSDEGCGELGLLLDEHMAICIEAMRDC
jgi:hypothetical protein